MTPLFRLLLTAYGLGAIGALLLGYGRFGRSVWGRAAAAIGAGAGASTGFVIGLRALITGETFTFDLPHLIPLTGFALHLDGLGAFFLIVIGTVGLATALYGFGYTAGYEGRYAVPLVGFLFNLLLLALTLQVLAGNALTFLLMWELMSLSAYWLVLTEHDQPGATQAGVWYIAMTHAGFVALVAMFLLLSGGELTTSFAAMRTHAGALPPLVRDVIFLLALFGFGSKAGVIPLHVWLPLAHPVAPSHVSALLSGVVIKMGIYGLLRVVLDLLGGGPTWWGGLILGLGAASALLGVLYALMEDDLKRLLAYSSVENMGIILIGLGVGLIFRTHGLLPLAVLGFVGCLYHTLNHAAFKGLLFLGAGAVLHATHTRNMEALGGLIKRMPWTAFYFLIGAAAISALPPLNGFVSEWLVFQALLGSFSLPVPELTMLMPVAVGMLALTSGLAVACFVKAFGITFLAIPRSPAAEQAHDAPRSMQSGMALLALACAGLGLAPFAVAPLLGGALAGLGGLPNMGGLLTTRSMFTLNWALTGAGGAGGGTMAPTWVAVVLLIMLMLLPAVMRVFGVNWRLRMGDSWGCGRIGQTPRMEYTSAAFAEPLRRVFAELYRPTQELTIAYHPESKYFVQSIIYKSNITPLFDQWLYTPLLSGVRATARQVRRLQAGSLHLYLMYVTLVLVTLLLAARWF